MYWYKRHLGDYAKKTGHLTVWEHGALTLLLDRFYATEKPLTNSDPYRICRPTTAKEKAALARLMEEFFTLTESGYINHRAMREIEAMQEKSLKSRKSADIRWKQTQCERIANAMLSKNQEPKKQNKERVADYLPEPKPKVYGDGISPNSEERWLSVVGSASKHRSGS